MADHSDLGEVLVVAAATALFVVADSDNHPDSHSGSHMLDDSSNRDFRRDSGEDRLGERRSGYCGSDHIRLDDIALAEEPRTDDAHMDSLQALLASHSHALDDSRNWMVGDILRLLTSDSPRNECHQAPGIVLVAR